MTAAAVERFHVAQLRAPVAGAFREMTFPSYRQLLDLTPTVRHREEGDERAIEPLAIAAYDIDGAAAGLALVERPVERGQVPALLSVFVAPRHRRQGLGTRLVGAVEDALREDGHDRVAAIYMTGKAGAEIFEHLTQRRGWSPPEPRMITLKATMEQACAMPWYKRYRPRQGFEIVSWQEVTSDEREALRREQQETGWIAEDLVPWRFDRRGFDPSSVGARLDGRVVGWVINHRINPATIRFTCSFMHPDLARRGRIVPLYSESIRRLAESSAVSRCIFTTPMHFPAMVTFVRRRIAPFATELAETRGVIKPLRPTGETP